MFSTAVICTPAPEGTLPFTISLLITARYFLNLRRRANIPGQPAPVAHHAAHIQHEHAVVLYLKENQRIAPGASPQANRAPNAKRRARHTAKNAAIGTGQ